MPTPSWPRLCGHWLADQLERADPGQVWRLRPFGSRGRAGGKLGTSARHGSRPTSFVSAGPLARGAVQSRLFRRRRLSGLADTVDRPTRRSGGFAFCVARNITCQPRPARAFVAQSTQTRRSRSVPQLHSTRTWRRNSPSNSTPSSVIRMCSPSGTPRILTVLTGGGPPG
jgi:hypothetical protein